MDWRLIFDLFQACLPADSLEREDILRQAAPHVRREVESLLTAAEAVQTKQMGLHPTGLGDKFAKAMASATMPLPFAPGHRLGNYTLTRYLASGAFSHIYVAQDLSLDRHVVLKTTRLANNEARIMAKLQHPHIVPVYQADYCAESDLYVTVMPYVPCLSLDRIIDETGRGMGLCGEDILRAVDRLAGETSVYDAEGERLRRRLRRADAIETACHIGIGVCAALAYTHSRGILHLDIKPGNILIDGFGNVRLTDFNVSVPVASLTEDGQRPGGTLPYMAPEHRLVFEGRSDAASIGPWTDIFSFGKLLDDIQGKVAPQAPLTALTARCTRESPESRPASARHVWHHLSSIRFLHRFYKRVPTSNLWLQPIERRPMLFLHEALLITNIAASLIQILYNKAFIIDRLSKAQQDAFYQALMPWNIFVFSLASLLLHRVAKDYFAYVRHGSRDGSVTAAQARRSLLRFLNIATPVVFVGWMSGFLVFTTVLYISDHLSPFIVFHMFASFLIAGFLAVSYSFLPLYYAVVSRLYPALLAGEENSAALSRRELAKQPRLLKAIHHMAGTTPLVGAGLMVASVSLQGGDTMSVLAWKVLVILLMLAGVLGFTVARRLTASSRQALAALRQ